jgi:hypothetical protein
VRKERDMQEKAYANVAWTVEDVIQNCRQLEIEVTRDAARSVLAIPERSVVDAMVKVGWEFIEDALAQG